MERRQGEKSSVHGDSKRQKERSTVILHRVCVCVRVCVGDLTELACEKVLKGSKNPIYFSSGVLLFSLSFYALLL